MTSEVANLLRVLVGASGFEPETSCAQGRRHFSRKSSSFNFVSEKKGG